MLVVEAKFVGTSAIDCLERLVSEVTCFVSNGALNCPFYREIKSVMIEEKFSCVYERSWL